MEHVVFEGGFSLVIFTIVSRGHTKQKLVIKYLQETEWFYVSKH